MTFSSAINDGHLFQAASPSPQIAASHYCEDEFDYLETIVVYEAASEHISNTALNFEKYSGSAPNNVISFGEVSLYKLLKRVRDISEYDVGWDGDDDSLPAREEAINEAESFLSVLPISDIHLPSINLSNDGEINFFWKTPNATLLSLSFAGEGSYSFYFKSNDGLELFGNDMPINKALPDTIVTDLLK